MIAAATAAGASVSLALIARIDSMTGTIPMTTKRVVMAIKT